MFFSNGSLFIANDCRTLKMDLNSNSHVLLVSNKTCSCTEVHGIAPFGDNGDIVFTDVGSLDGHVEIIAGTGETGNRDGSRASFSQPVGICVENNKIFQPEVTDAQVGAGGARSEAWNRVSMITPVKKFGRARLSTDFR